MAVGWEVAQSSRVESCISCAKSWIPASNKTVWCCTPVICGLSWARSSPSRLGRLAREPQGPPPRPRAPPCLVLHLGSISYARKANPSPTGLSPLPLQTSRAELYLEWASSCNDVSLGHTLSTPTTTLPLTLKLVSATAVLDTEVTPVTSALTLRFLKAGTKKHWVTAPSSRFLSSCHSSILCYSSDHLLIQNCCWNICCQKHIRALRKDGGEKKKHPPPPFRYISYIMEQKLRFMVPFCCKGSWEDLLYWGLSCGT